MIISTISSMEKGDPKLVKDTPAVMGHNAAKSQQPYRKDDKQAEEVQSTKQAGK